MRKILIGIFFIGIAIAIVPLRRPTPITPGPIPSPTLTISPSPSPPLQSTDVNHSERTYRVAWLLVRDPTALSLIPNFSEKRTARSFIDNKECKEVINGGFYTKDNQPTGLFVTQGKTIHGSIPNTLLNGYVIVDQDDTALILSTPPDASIRLALQTGPFLIREGRVVRLAIRDDEFARRMVAATTQKGEVVFLVIYDPENPWSGPKLADTPAIMSTVAGRLQLTEALNLDGGSASTFIRGDLSLEELTSVGSFFCIREII